MASQQIAIPLALHSISPTLSAFHIDRARRHLRSGGEEDEERLFDNLLDTHCPSCRRFQLDGSADTRLVRDNKHRSTPSVILQKSCRSCGFTRRTSLLKTGATVFQNQRKRNRKNENLKSPGTTMEMEGKTQSTTRAQSPPITPVTQPSQFPEPAEGPKKSKNRKARSSGLKEMLERKRKRDQVEPAGASLASFLQRL